MMEINIKNLNIKEDERGWLSEILKKDHLKNKEFGQIFITVAKPGKVKGNHYHKRKEEWFCVIKGEGKLLMEDINTKEKKEIEMGKKNLVAVQFLPNIAHSIKNIGEEDMYLLVYVSEVFNEDDTDTFSYNL